MTNGSGLPAQAGWTIDQTTGRLTTAYGIDLGGNSIQNVSAIIGQNWKIDEHGKITAKELCLDDVCIARDQLKALLEKNQIDSFAPAL